MAIGDHLFVRYWGFTHHAIDVGDGTVVEYGGKGGGSLRIRRVPIAEFARRGKVFCRWYAPGTALRPTQVVQRALTRLHEQRYDLLDNNCEQFAHWCKTGRHLSPQAEDLKSVLLFAIGLAGLSVLSAA